MLIPLYCTPIENKTASKINFNDIIDNFLKEKNVNYN